MIITIIYLLLIAYIVILSIWNLYETRSLSEKTLGAIVLVMWILRLLLIK